ncbi:V4R domain-containing protein [Methanocaldococcus sp.]
MCSFEAGLINGAINNIYNKECETIELKCCALGDQYCLFKTKLQ